MVSKINVCITEKSSVNFECAVINTVIYYLKVWCFMERKKKRNNILIIGIIYTSVDLLKLLIQNTKSAYK